MHKNSQKYSNIRVSVVIPCFNHGQFLLETINTVLNQSHKNIQIVIVDDASTDSYTIQLISTLSKEGFSTPGLVKLNEKRDILVLKNETNLLPSKTKNIAIQNSDGDYILPLDADDLITNDFLKKTLPKIVENKEVGIVGTGTEAFMAENWVQIPEFNADLFPIQNQLVNTCLFRKKDWEKVGGYKEEMNLGWEDYELWISLLETGLQVEIVPEALFKYRKYGKQHNPAKKNTIRMQEEDLDRKLKLHKMIVNLHPSFYREKLPQILEYSYNQEKVILNLKDQLARTIKGRIIDIKKKLGI